MQRIKLDRRSVVLAGMSSLLPIVANARSEVVGTVPLTWAANGSPVVTGYINDKGPYRFILDSGADSSGINETIAAADNLSVVGQRHDFGLGVRQGETRYRADHVSISSGLAFRNFEFFGMPFIRTEGIDGLMSVGSILKRELLLDFQRASLTSTPDATQTSGFLPLKSRVRLSRTSRLYYISLQIDGVSLNALFDTGAGGTLYLASRFVKTAALWDKYPAMRTVPVISGTGGRPIEGREVLAHSVDFGSFSVTGQKVILASPDKDDNLSRGGIDALIGMDFLKNFDILFTRESVALRPNTANTMDLSLRS